MSLRLMILTATRFPNSPGPAFSSTRMPSRTCPKAPAGQRKRGEDAYQGARTSARGKQSTALVLDSGTGRCSPYGHGRTSALTGTRTIAREITFAEDIAEDVLSVAAGVDALERLAAHRARAPPAVPKASCCVCFGRPRSNGPPWQVPRPSAAPPFCLAGIREEKKARS